MTEKLKALHERDSEVELKQQLEDRPCVILTNYGDDSLALIQWVFENNNALVPENVPLQGNVPMLGNVSLSNLSVSDPSNTNLSVSDTSEVDTNLSVSDTCNTNLSVMDTCNTNLSVMDTCNVDTKNIVQGASLVTNASNRHRMIVVYVETGFAGEAWAERVALGKKFVQIAGFEAIHLTSKITFQEAVIERGEFPTPKFQWCSTVLKGLPLLDWLDEADPSCRFVILSAKRRNTLLPPYDNLPKWQEKVEHFNGRSVWHPLIDYTEAERDNLLKHAGFEPLYHRSLECDPCINSCSKTLARLSEKDTKRIKILEETLGKPLFEPLCAKEDADATNNIDDCDDTTRSDLTLFYRGCGNPFSCGL